MAVPLDRPLRPGLLTQDVKDFRARCVEVLGLLDTLPEAAEDFRGTSAKFLASTSEWARENNHVTPKMRTAVGNIAAGAAKWLAPANRGGGGEW